MKAFISYPIMADYFYIADTAHLPYGLKTHFELYWGFFLKKNS